MITGGESYYAILRGAHDYIDPKYPDNLSYYKNGGFGLFSKNYYIDTHYGARGRIGRQIALMMDLASKTNIYYGIGIDENTALVV